MQYLKKYGKIALLPVLLFIALITSVTSSFQENKILLLQKKMVSEENTDTVSTLFGFPPFISDEMIIGALKTQEQYRYPASVCIAQIIGESGFGQYGPGEILDKAYLFLLIIIKIYLGSRELVPLAA